MELRSPAQKVGHLTYTPQEMAKRVDIHRIRPLILYWNPYIIDVNPLLRFPNLNIFSNRFLGKTDLIN